MGLYSNNRTSLSDVEIPALEGYNGNVGIATALLEATQDDLKFFDTIIARDFQEAEMNLSGYTNESEMISINEGALGDAWNRLKEFLKKMLAKIKAVFSSIMAKINGTIISDNKKLVEKYRKAVLTKNLKDMKYKWAAKKANATLLTDKVTEAWIKDFADIDNCKTIEEVNNWIEKNEDELIEKYYGLAVGENSLEASEFAKAAHEYMFDDVEDMDEGADSLKAEVISYLLSCKESISTLEKAIRTSEKGIAAEIKKADTRIKEAVKKVPEKDGSVTDANKLELAKANACYRVAVKYQTVIMAINRENINAVKYQTAQSRAFFTKAAAYNPKAKNESVELFDAIDEAVEFDVYTAFADYE